MCLCDNKNQWNSQKKCQIVENSTAANERSQADTILESWLCRDQYCTILFCTRGYVGRLYVIVTHFGGLQLAAGIVRIDRLPINHPVQPSFRFVSQIPNISNNRNPKPGTWYAKIHCYNDALQLAGFTILRCNCCTQPSRHHHLPNQLLVRRTEFFFSNT